MTWQSPNWDSKLTGPSPRDWMCIQIPPSWLPQTHPATPLEEAPLLLWVRHWFWDSLQTWAAVQQKNGAAAKQGSIPPHKWKNLEVFEVFVKNSCEGSWVLSMHLNSLFDPGWLLLLLHGIHDPSGLPWIWGPSSYKPRTFLRFRSKISHLTHSIHLITPYHPLSRPHFAQTGMQPFAVQHQDDINLPGGARFCYAFPKEQMCGASNISTIFSSKAWTNQGQSVTRDGLGVHRIIHLNISQQTVDAWVLSVLAFPNPIESRSKLCVCVSPICVASILNGVGVQPGPALELAETEHSLPSRRS